MAQLLPVSPSQSVVPIERRINITAATGIVALKDFSYDNSSSSVGGLELRYFNAWDFGWWQSVNPDDRVRSQLTSGISDVVSGFGAIEISASESFFTRVIQPDEDVVYDDVFGDPQIVLRQINKNTDNSLLNYTYQSPLSRLNTTKPDAFIAQATDYGQGTLTASEWLNELFSLWSQRYEWFEFEPIPKLHPRIRNSVGVFDVELSLPAMFIEQPIGNERSMRQIIDEILAIFEGHTLSMTAIGSFKIVPPYWSDAYDEGEITLALEELYTLPTDLPEDRSQLVNRVRVTSQGYSYVADQQIINPSYHLDTVGDPLTDSRPETSERKRVVSFIPWLSDQTLVGGNTLEVALTHELYFDDEFETQVEAFTRTLTRGQTTRIRLKYTYDKGLLFRSTDFYVSYYLTFENNGIYIQVDREGAGFIDGKEINYILLIDAVGSVFQKQQDQISAEFGRPEDVDQLPELAESLARFGETARKDITSSVFPLTVGQCLLLAQATVDVLMRPRILIEVQQGYWEAFRVGLYDIGRRINLPNAISGVLKNWRYRDDYAGSVKLVENYLEIEVTEAFSAEYAGETKAYGETTYGNTVYQEVN